MYAKEVDTTTTYKQGTRGAKKLISELLERMAGANTD